jgi:hypothetical protein
VQRQKKPSHKIDDKAASKAALVFEREQRQRESERRKEEAARTKQRERREKAVAKAQAAIEQAKAEHDERASTLESERASREKRLQAEDACWEKQRKKLEARAYRLAARKRKTPCRSQAELREATQVYSRLAALPNLNSSFGFAGPVRQAWCEAVVSAALLWCFGPERVCEPFVPIHRSACVISSARDISWQARSAT